MSISNTVQDIRKDLAESTNYLLDVTKSEKNATHLPLVEC